MATRGSYVLYITLVDFFGGHPENVSCMQLTKLFTRLLELVQLYKQNPLEKVFIFTIYQNYTLAFTLLRFSFIFGHGHIL